MSSLLSIRRLSKAYGGVVALNDVSFSVERGEVHALCGENGAGKSTLIKCLAGVTVPDAGNVSVQDKQLVFGNVVASEEVGIAVIHQESTTFPDLDIVDNIFVGREKRNRFGFLDRKRMQSEAAALMSRLSESQHVLRPLRDLPLANRQMVTIARALSRDCRLLIMDEPTASLSAQETEVLLSVTRNLRESGVGIIYVSHRLSEVMEIADRVTVLRDGGYVGTSPITEIDERALIRQMVGRDFQVAQGRQAPQPGEAMLDVRQLTAEAFTDISLTLHRGEIVGLAGLVGAGRSELVRSIVGLDPYSSGQVWLGGKPLPPNDVPSALALGIALVPEDRQHQGLVLPMSVSVNLTLAVLRQLTRGGLIDRGMEGRLVADLVRKVDVRCASSEVAAESLSGGNQQKVVLGKWLATRPSVLILDEPTRGIDVGAKAQVHRLILELAGQADGNENKASPTMSSGIATLVISSEFPELLAICDRILVMREGTIAGELTASAATPEKLLELALPKSTALVR